MRSPLKAFAVLGVVSLMCLAAAVIGTAAANAAARYVHVGSYDAAAGLGIGNPPGRLAVHQASGRLFALDIPNHRVRIFKPDYEAEEVSEMLLPVLDLGDGAIQSPTALTVDQASGDLFVSKTGAPAGIVKYNMLDPGGVDDTPDYEVDTEFNSPTAGSGADQVGSFGAGVASNPRAGGMAVGRAPGGSPVLLLADPEKNVVHSFNLDGTRAAIFPDVLPYLPNKSTFNGRTSPSGVFNGLRDIAADSSGNLLIANSLSDQSRYEQFDAGGAFLGAIEEVPNPFTLLGVAAAFDSWTSEAFLSSKEIISSPTDIMQFEPGSLVPRRTVGVPNSQGYVAGIAVDTTEAGSPGRLYVSTVTSNLFFGTSSIQIYEHQGELPDPPDTRILGHSDIASTSVRISGEIDWNGASEMSWWFEYRPESDDPSVLWTSGPVTSTTRVGEDPSFPVDAVLSGLEPNLKYEIRLAAENEDGGTAESPGIMQIQTLPAAPAVGIDKAWSLAETKATLVGQLDGLNSAASYRFEYGVDGGGPTESTTLRHVHPSSGAIQVVEEVTGLSPDTRYRFRLVAVNSSYPELELGSETEYVIFETRPEGDSTLQQRAVELVSAPDTNGVDVDPRIISESGNEAIYWAFIPTPGAANAGYTYRRAVRRQDGRWTRDHFAAEIPVDPDATFLGHAAAPLFNADLSISVRSTAGNYDSQDVNRPGLDSDIYELDSTSGSMKWISWGEQLPEDRGGTMQTEYLSPGGDRVIFRTDRRLLPGVHPAGNALYLRGGGDLDDLEILSVPPGQPNAVAGTLGSGSGTEGVTHNAVAADGSRVAWQSTGVVPSRVYLWGENQGSSEVSGAAGGHFWGADDSLTTIVYSAGDDLWTYEEDEPTAVRTKLSPEGVSLNRVIYVAEDGSRVYWASAAPDSMIYVSERQSTGSWPAEVVAPYDHNEDLGGDIGGDEWSAYPGLRFSETMRQAWGDHSGTILAFRHRANLVPGKYTGGHAQVYVYEADRRELSCLSCPSDAESAIGPARLVDPRKGEGTNNRFPHVRNVSDRGSVFFQAVSPLVPGDGNSSFDVYEWRGGELQMLSSGVGDDDATLGDATPDGETVLFRSTVALTPEATPGVRAVYAARLGGGMKRPEVTAPCQGEDCRAGSHTQPTIPARVARSRAAGNGPDANPGCRVIGQRVQRVRRHVVRTRGTLRRVRAAVRSMRHRSVSERSKTAMRTRLRKAAAAHRKGIVRNRALSRRHARCIGGGS